MTNTKHTPGALRAGRNISERFRRALPNLPESNALTLAEIIDRETAAPAMLEALEAAIAAMNHMGDVLNGMDCVMPEDEKYSPAFDKVRAAIRLAVGETDQARK